MSVIKIRMSDGSFVKIPTLRGKKGDLGKTPLITIGTVGTVPAGSSAKVTITGTQEEPKLNFLLPTGPTGSTGAAGSITISQTVTQETGTVPSNKAVSDYVNNLLFEDL